MYGKTENFTLYFLMGPSKPITLKLAKWFTGTNQRPKEDSSDTFTTAALDIFDYGLVL
jgi:hypothetical protein